MNHRGSGSSLSPRCPSDVVFGCGGAGNCVLGREVVFGGTVGTEEPPTQDEEGRGAPTDEERRPELTFLCARQHRVVELSHDGIGRPANGDEAQNAGNDEGDAGRHADLGFGSLVLHAVGALASGDAQEDGEDADQDGDDHEGSGRLQVLRKRQHGVVNLALHLARALNHALHPNALPGGLSRDDVLSDEGRHPPLGDNTRNNGPDPSDDGQGNSQDLKPSRCHASS